MVTANATTDELGEALWQGLSMAGIRPDTGEFNSNMPAEEEYDEPETTRVGRLLGSKDDMVGRRLMDLGARAEELVEVTRARNRRRSRYQWYGVSIYRMGSKIKVVQM